MKDLRCWIIILVLQVTWLLSCTPVKDQDSAIQINRDKPNIVFFLTDDHRYDCMGFLGHPFLKTPGFDRIADEGVFLKNAFVTTHR